jgi:hypothetical protein
MEVAVPTINNKLDELWAAENFFNAQGQILINLKWHDAKQPRMKVERTVAGGNWKQALDVPVGQKPARCQLVIETTGNGQIRDTKKLMHALESVGADLPSLKPLPGNTAGNLADLKKAYRQAAKQIWLQYPYMDGAMVHVEVPDISIFFGGRVAREFLDLIAKVGVGGALDIPVVDEELRPRIRQVSDDLNMLMYNQIGCGAVAPFVAGHGPMVCESDNGKPMVVITRGQYPGWGAAMHQNTVIGGMPHENADGANVLGAGLVEADRLAAP